MTLQKRNKLNRLSIEFNEKIILDANNDFNAILSQFKAVGFLLKFTNSSIYLIIAPFSSYWSLQCLS